MKLKNFIKHNRLIYVVYYYLFSTILRLIGLFIAIDDESVLFLSYGGKKYDDSPKFVYQYIKDCAAYSQLKPVWAFKDPDAFPEVTDKVKVDSLAYFLTAIKSKYWITNSSCARGLNFKKRGTINVLFQHGMAGIKKIGSDIENKKGTYRQFFNEKFDYIFIEGKEEATLLEKAWGINRDRLFLTGLPRNDDLVGVSEIEIESIKQKLRIPQGKKVILYAPTFREERVDSAHNSVLNVPFDFGKWEKNLSNEYVLLITAHYEVERLLDTIPNNEFIFNVFNYPVLNDLLKITDIMITDYSSIVFDYSILERPIFCYGYDYEEYMENRGTYNDLNTLFSHGVIQNEDELISQIKSIDYEKECSFTKERIKDRFIASYGNATEKATKLVFGSDTE